MSNHQDNDKGFTPDEHYLPPAGDNHGNDSYPEHSMHFYNKPHVPYKYVPDPRPQVELLRLEMAILELKRKMAGGW